MDIERVGNFLSELRRKKGLSQEQLGEKIGVTNKTISRWETGKYLPPVDALEALSNFYGITINEILSGKSLSAEEFKKSAEENLKDTLSTSAFTIKDKIEFYKSKWKKDHAMGMIIEVILIGAVIITGIVLNNIVLIFGLMAAFVWTIVKYNQMMAYVEKNTFH